MSEQSTMERISEVRDEHRALEPFVGTFAATVRLWMGPGDPNVSTGTMVNSWDLGGRFLRQIYTGDPNDGPFPSFEGRGYWGFNNDSGKYEGFWIDNASTFMQTEEGAVDESGNVWTMTGTMINPETGQEMTRRSVITLKDSDHHDMEMYFAVPNGNEFKSMEIEYTRKSGA